MLRLKKLQINGFKSFGDRTDLVFPGQGVVGVVGPNGCGKSNLADAICWVLGEQSAKSLRGQRMEEVIFSGSRDRPATGRAEVSLTLVNPQEQDGESEELPLIEASDDWEPEPGGESSQAADAAADMAGEAADAPAAAVPAERGEAVVLTLRKRRKFVAHNRRGEIVVTRRLFRSGESEYLMNGRPCRLRDIQDLFMGTGLGPESYAIIEQGRIGQILSSKPHDRRAMIEEAAGVTKYKARKKLAEAKLEAARQNLSRINDIFEEVARQMNALKRQAAKARRYAELKSELDTRQRRLLQGKAAQLAAEWQQVTDAHAQLGATLRERQRELTEAEERRTRWFGEVSQLERELRELTEALGRWAMELDRAERQIEFNRQQAEDLQRREALLTEEIARLDTEHAAAAEAAARAGADAATIAGEATRARAAFAEQRSQAQTGMQQQQQLEQRLQQTRARLLTNLGRMAQLGNETAQSETLLTSFDRQLTRIEQESDQGRQELEALGARRGQLHLAFDGQQSALAALGEALAGLDRKTAELRQTQEAARQQREQTKDGLAQVAARRQSLDEIVAHHGYSTEAVRALFELKPSGSGAALEAPAAIGFHPLGLLADFLEVEAEYEGVVEEFLREELNFVVVKTWDDADAGVGLLRRDAQGRATFLVHPEDGHYPMFPGAEAGHGDAGAAGGAAAALAPVPLRNCVRVLNGFGRTLEHILPKLGSGYILPDSHQARELAASNPQAYFLTASGECFHNQTVTGGTRSTAGPLTLKRELRELAQQESDLRAAMEQLDARMQLVSRELALADQERERLAAQQRELEKELLTSGESLKALENEVKRAEERLQLFVLEAERGRAERRQAAERLEQLRALTTAAEQERASTEAEEGQITAALSAAQQQREDGARALANAQAELARWEERARAGDEARARLQRGAEELAQRREQAKSDAQTLCEQRQQIEAASTALARQLEGLAVARADGEAKREQLRARLAETQAAGAALEQAAGAAREAIEECRQRHGEAEVALARLQSEANYLNELCRNELHCELSELRAAPAADGEVAAEAGAAEPAALPAEEIAALEAAVRELRGRIENLGPVNMMALEEFNETEQRHQFLSTQRQDLLDSIADTQKAIQEIDTVSREQFNAAFEKINAFFQETFKKLFGGGQGFLRLTDAESDPECGVDIVAQPPGKKLQNALLLSGGEKAMTAMALLLAIFQHQPSPFCLLDEVDAPLDEANVGRFTEMVRLLSRDTQFIIITHNTRTMESAAVLYGVTMPQAGVSRLVSVEMEQARRAAV